MLSRDLTLLVLALMLIVSIVFIAGRAGVQLLHDVESRTEMINSF